jgi:MYXO-CTERM domain-containing protein
LKIVNQDGNTSPLPPEDAGWAGETALDLDMASATCPKCKIVLVQANNADDTGLFIAQETAAKMGASVVSDSWGGPEDGMEATYEKYFQLSNKATVFVASGDSGYTGTAPDYPSTSAFAVAVGGTALKKSATTTRGWTETAWSGAGSSCSKTIPKPSYQGATTTCAQRATADVSAVGSPSTGVAVYQGGWQVVGGTSASAPLVAGIFALTGHSYDGASFIYAHTDAFIDVTSGSNGSCTGALCKAGAGWDGPTGIGVPDGKKLPGIAGGNTPADMAMPRDMASPPDMSAAPDLAEPAGGGGTGGTGGGGGTGTGGNGAGNGPMTKDSGCGCTLGAAAPDGGSWIAMLLVAGALVWRRRRVAN